MNAEEARKPETTIILPAYNEAEAIAGTVAAIKRLHPDFEVLVIDDGSTDATAAEAERAGARVCRHPYNMGNGAAIKTGLREARGEWVVMMDADGQHEPADIARLLEHKDKFDMVVGARDMGGQASLHRGMANWIYNRLASFVTKFKVEDLTSGFRLVKKEVAEQFLYLLPNTFSYPTTLTMAYLRCGRTIRYVPITVRRRKSGSKSKIKLFRDGTRFFLIITKIATLFSPLRVFLPVSFLFFLLGAGNYAYTYITAHRFTNMSAMLFSSAVIIFMMGLVSEQITQMRYDRTR